MVTCLLLTTAQGFSVLHEVDAEKSWLKNE